MRLPYQSSTFKLKSFFFANLVQFLKRTGQKQLANYKLVLILKNHERKFQSKIKVYLFRHKQRSKLSGSFLWLFSRTNEPINFPGVYIAY